jgi:hypothetical protein
MDIHQGELDTTEKYQRTIFLLSAQSGAMDQMMEIFGTYGSVIHVVDDLGNNALRMNEFFVLFV